MRSALLLGVKTVRQASLRLIVVSTCLHMLHKVTVGSIVCQTRLHAGNLSIPFIERIQLGGVLMLYFVYRATCVFSWISLGLCWRVIVINLLIMDFLYGTLRHVHTLIDGCINDRVGAVLHLLNSSNLIVSV